MTRGAQVLNDMWEKLKAERNDVVNEETFFWLCKALRALERGNVLDKIRADIEELKMEDNSRNICFKVHNEVVESVLKIIDKYRADKTESEE